MDLGTRPCDCQTGAQQQHPPAGAVLWN